MTTDAYTKFMLGVVAACLVVLAAQGFDLGAATADRDSEGLGLFSRPRYNVMPIPRSRFILRVDNQTGETWRMMIPEAEEWVPVMESMRAPAGPLENEAADPAPAQELIDLE